MNRRAFLIGCAAAAVAGTVPIIPKELAVYGRSPAMDALDDLKALQELYNQWLRDALPILSEYQMNVFLYGTGALKQIKEYPYIESIHPKDLISLDFAEGIGYNKGQ